LVLLDGEPHIVQQVLQSGPTGPVRAKLTSMNSGRTFAQSWERGSAIVYVATESQPATYSYFDEDSDSFVFYGDKDGEEFRVGNSEFLSGASKWLVEGNKVDLKLFEGKVLNLGIRGDVIAKVVDVRPTSNPRKTMPAKNKHRIKQRVFLSNGVAVTGPNYLKVGDRVVVDPATSEIKRKI